MKNKLKNKLKLPVVTDKAIESTLDELNSVGEAKYLEKTINRLKIENPYVLEFVYKMVKNSKDPQKGISTALILYEMIESQHNLDEKKREKYGQN